MSIQDGQGVPCSLCCQGTTAVDTSTEKDADGRSQLPSKAISTAIATKPAALHHDWLRGRSLRSLPGHTLEGLPQHLVALDVSRNELCDLPGLGCLTSLTELNLQRNWFRTMPEEISCLQKLQTLDASRNFFRPTEESLRLSMLRKLPELNVLDLRFNKKCNKQSHAERLDAQLEDIAVHLTISFPAPPGAFIGSRPSDRDATTLRAQLEPWPTYVLRRRLVEDFNQPVTDPKSVGRAEVMETLLRKYTQELNGSDRQVVQVEGIPVSAGLCEEILAKLKVWAGQRKQGNERPSIKATNYMILRAPDKFQEQAESNAARQAAVKLEKHHALWALARQAMEEVDPEYARTFSALAVTHGFRGSPHIDKQNVGPFYGLSLGDFPDGEGGICVECNSMVVAQVNTRNRLGKVDGRYPHWVAPYPEDKERYSLIYYQTDGDYSPPGHAIFAASPPDLDSLSACASCT